jgi:hypothetical protein
VYRKARTEAATKLTDRKPRSSLIHSELEAAVPEGENVQVSYRKKCVKKRTD